MGTSRKITESQLEKAKAALAIRVAALKQKGIEGKSLKRDPKWRELDGKLRQINARLGKLGEIEQQNADLLQHREERQAQVAARKAEKKTTTRKARKDEKKPKDKPKAKSEGKGAPKKEKAPKS